ncbi:MAG TPA: neutral zinc metallopeptidase [Polyangiaceae bacterium]
MRYDDDHESPDLIDRRGERPGIASAGTGLFSLLPLLLRWRYGWVVILGIVGYYGYTALRSAPTQNAANTTTGPGNGSVLHDAPAHFVAFVLDDVQGSWERDFAQRGRPYRHAKLVLFTNATATACGTGQSATGPFYCPEDERVYIDLGFYQELEQRLGARGQFAKAYVIAHEIGHHVQHLLGIDKRPDAHGEGATGGSVRLELQADCYAGIWAHTTQQRQILQQGDIASALGAAAAIGDDTLQREARGVVRPDTFTHGTSAQRERWFNTGYTLGTIEACDTFGTKSL